MKIAHIASPDFPINRKFGGTEALICNLVDKQVSKGHDVTIVAFDQDSGSSIQPISLIKPARFYSQWFVNWLSHRFNGAIHVCKSFTYLDSRFDIIHNHLSEEGIAFSFLREAPCLNTLHGAAHARFPQYCISRLYSITRNTKLVALSKSAYLQHKRFYGQDMLGYVYNGINLKAFDFVPNVEKSSEFELCFSGRFSPDKSVKEVIQIADMLVKRGVDVHLKLIGKFDPRNANYFHEVIKMANDRSYVSKHIDVARPVQLASLIGNSDVFVFPISVNEPFALAPLEAMCCGTPLVSLKRAAAIEYVENGVNGFLCKNISEMADAVLRYKEISRKVCRQIVEQKFSVDSMYKSYMEMYEKVIEAS